MLLRKLHTVPYRVVYESGSTRAVGWQTRDLLVSGKPRDLVLFSSVPNEMLSRSESWLLQKVREELERIQQEGGRLRTAATKHLVNQLFEGTSPFGHQPALTIALHRFGPVPAVVFGNEDNLRLAAYVRFRSPDAPREQPYPSDRYNRLVSYRHSGPSLLFTHYLEHVGARFHDMQWHRSVADALLEAGEIRREIIESIFGKLSDIKLGCDSDEDLDREEAAGIQNSYTVDLGRVRFASYFALHLITEFLRLYGIRDQLWDYDKRIRRLGRPVFDPDVDDDFESLFTGWAAYARRDLPALEVAAKRAPSVWATQILTFADFLVEVEQLLAGLRVRTLALQPAFCFASLFFKADNAPTASRIVERLPQEFLTRRVPMRLLVGTAKAEANLVATISRKIFVSDLVVPFIPAKSGDPERSYDWIIRETDHACICEKRVIPAVTAEESDLPTVLNELRSRQFDWFSRDERAPTSRRDQVSEALKKRPFYYADSGPTVADENFLNELRQVAITLVAAKARAYIEYFLGTLDDQVLRLTAFILLYTSRLPAKKSDLIRAAAAVGLLSSNVNKALADFRRLRESHNRKLGYFGNQEGPLVGYDRKTAEYASGVTRYLNSLAALTEAEALAVHRQIAAYLLQYVSRPRLLGACASSRRKALEELLGPPPLDDTVDLARAVRPATADAVVG